MKSTTHPYRARLVYCGALLAAGAIVAGLNGCAGGSNFVRFRNPLLTDKEYDERMLARRRAAEERALAERYGHVSPGGSRTAPAGSLDEEAAADEKRFFARSKRAPREGAGERATDGKLPHDWEALVVESEVPAGRGPASRPDPAASARSAERDPGAILLSEGTLNRKTGGKLCYPCNGKGFRVETTGQHAEAVICPVCSGSGRDLRN